MKDKIAVLYEDKNFLALYKPAGILVHKVKSLKLKVLEETLVDWVLDNYPEVKKVGDDTIIRPGIVHRLDKDTSGIILIARNQEFFNYLKNLFQTGKIKKNYLALVCGKLEPKTGIIEKPISLKTGTTKRTVWKGKIEKEAITEFKVIKFLKLKVNKVNKEKEQIFSLLEVMPKTGRTHQIRVHLASIGHPIVGDFLYGKKENILGLKRQFLHAQSLEFSLPDNKRIKIECDLPEDLNSALSKLENS